MPARKPNGKAYFSCWTWGTPGLVLVVDSVHNQHQAQHAFDDTFWGRMQQEHTKGDADKRSRNEPPGRLKINRLLIGHQNAQAHGKPCHGHHWRSRRQTHDHPQKWDGQERIAKADGGTNEGTEEQQCGCHDNEWGSFNAEIDSLCSLCYALSRAGSLS